MRVLQSFPEPRATTNPYLVLLRRELVDHLGTTVLTFSWRTALVGRYDVVHLHWPENLIAARTAPRRWRRRLLTVAWMLRIVLSRTPVVRTVHNIGLPQGLARQDVLLLRLVDRLTTLRIRLNVHTDVPADRPVVTIPHGDYRSWQAGCSRSATTPGRLAYVGQIRRYKGVERLLRAYRDVRSRDGSISLRVSGQPTSPDTAKTLRSLADGIAGLELDLGHLDDADMVTAVDTAELVVLPYPFMHNSGTVLYALSLGRAVLVPDNDVNRDLADEVGTGWVRLYTGELDADTLLTALTDLRAHPPTSAPNLTGRDWGASGRAHLDAYRSAVASRRRRRARG